MNKQNLQPLKGFRDFLPSEARKRQYALKIIRDTFELFGFEPLETPALERQELLLGKYGEEADKMVYTFSDQGGRKIGLKYDQTVPIARVIAAYRNNLGLPFMRYQIQPVWRAENPQKGRFREFLQCDIDIFGEDSLLADAQIITTTLATYQNLGFANPKMLINSRSLLFEFINQAGIEKGKALSTIQTLDKLDKKPVQKVKKELKDKGIPNDQIDQLFTLIDQAKPNDQLKELFRLCQQLAVNKDQLQFQPTLARGLDYYTSTIFELKSPDFDAGTLAGGGRYDDLIGKLSDFDLPAVGLAIGFDRTLEAMEELELFPENLSTAQILVTIFDEKLREKSLKLASQLREANINTLLYPTAQTDLDKQLKYADKKKVSFVAIIGPDEAKKDKVTLKNMETGQQELLSSEELIEKLS